MKMLIAALAFLAMMPIAQAHNDDEQGSTGTGTQCVVFEGQTVCS